LIDPLDLDALVHALERLLTDSALRERMITAGTQRTAQFTWERSAAQLRDIYTTLLQSR